MGVHNLWELLSPIGRRVSVETLAGKKLAIDASIWMVQFMKAMRDEKGDMVRNAHLLGFFRRICKLLYLKTKPVFVFDGGTPILKRRTVIARRRQRENAQAKIRKTAEKLLLNHLKKMRLKELADDLEIQRRMQKKDNVSTGEAYQSNMTENNQKLREKSETTAPVSHVASNTSKAASRVQSEGEHVDEDWDLAEIDGNVDPDVLAALPPSMQRKFLAQADIKGKSMIHGDTGQFHEEENIQQQNVEASNCYSQENPDEMLAASLMAEEGLGMTHGPATFTAALPSEEDDEDEEMLLPVMNGNVDPAVLAALPPSMQLDLLVQMRERLMAENRQKYQKVKKAPDKFSELQIQSYLKTVAFRREIDEVQKAASGRGIGGVQTSRIASESNREFIFSSSFTGDKQALTSASVEKNGDKQTQIQSKHPSEFLSSINGVNKSSDVAEVDANNPGSAAEEGVETYMDERGRMRVSRVRAMGIRMTRDLQRNLDLMKEIEQEKMDSRNAVDDDPAQDKDSDFSAECPSSGNKFAESEQDGCGESMNFEVAERQSVLNETSVEVTFECDGKNIGFDEDDIFLRLAAGDGDSLQEPSTQKSPTEKSFDSNSDVDWEEVNIQEQSNRLDDNVNVRKETSSHESEVDWKEPPKCPESSSDPDESRKAFSKGFLEEEAGLQEAIRRSLIDISGKESGNVSVQIEKSNKSGEVSCKGMEVLMKKQTKEVPRGKNIAGKNKLCYEITHGVGNLSSVGNAKASDTVGCSAAQLKISVAQVSDIQMPKPSDKYHDSSSQHSREDTHENINIDKRMSFVDSRTGLEGKEDPCDWNTCIEGGQSLISSSGCHMDSSHNLTGKLADGILLEKKSNSEALLSVLLGDIKEQNDTSDFFMEPDRNKLTSDLCAIEGKIVETTSDTLVNGGEMKMDKGSINGNNHVPIDFTQANLDEEFLILGEEFRNLGDEQRKLERTAESVSSEMFAECQELLQMFGLPYIIAPMEAEAQCAYLELANLVDGVVTDDSDVFLFGARSVYKNIFDDRKYVETYFMEDIEKELGLTREKLVRMALLLGSDYTEGVSGIGIVNAIEVVNAFPEDDGLSNFREWIESPDPSILGKYDVNGSAGFCPNSGQSLSGQNIGQAIGDQKSADMKDIKQTFMDKHRNVSKNWHLPSSFPSKDVILAYSSPQVDKSTEPFSWGKPDHFVLRRFCWEKFGWGTQKTDELLMRVLKEYEKRETQLRLEAFYTFNERFAKIRSKRIKKAVKGITGNISSELLDDRTKDIKKVSKKRKDNHVGSGGQTVPEIRKKKKKPEDLIPCEAEKQECSAGENNRQNTNKKSNVNQRGKGRGAGRGRGKGTHDFEQCETSTSDDGTIYEHHIPAKKFEQPQEVRRSVRARKPVSYAFSDQEIDETSIQAKDEDFSRAEAKEQEFFDPQDKYGVFGAGDNKNQDEESNPAGEGTCREYLVSGGGFSSDEGKDASGTGDPSLDTGLSKDYLETGGGFCLDDDDASKGRNAALNLDSSGTQELSHRPCFMQEDIDSDEPVAIPGGSCGCSTMVDEEKRGSTNVSSSNVASVVNEGRVYESLQEKANIKLSAMPYLKRKSRKS